MTDVLGTCLRWSDGECVVQPDDGPAVTIPLALVVSGKPVPPRPSPYRRIPARDVELHGLTLWPGTTTEWLGQWVLRATPPVDGRLRRRGNSALAMGDPGLPLAEAAVRVEDFYAARDQQPLVMVEAGADEEAELEQLGWSGRDLPSAHAQVASVARAARLAGPAPDADVVHDDDIRVELVTGGSARGRASLDGDWLGIHGMHVDPDARRRGLATGVVAALLAWGAERGATVAWLHVETDNPAAITLYEGLGFSTHHTYRYLSSAPAG